jgi:hypothetical protein
MLNFLTNLNYENYVILSITISVIGVTFCLVNSFSEFNNVTRVRQIDTTRVQEGLPTDITLTPEDFRAHPELTEIFGVTDTDNNLDLILESNEHFEHIQNQYTVIDYDSIMTLYDVIEAFISTLN